MGEIALRVHHENDSQEVMVSPEATVSDLIGALIEELRLETTDGNGRPIQWLLFNKETARTLDPGHSLTNENLRSGQELYLRRDTKSPAPPQPPLPVPPPPKERTLGPSWGLVALLLALCAALGAGAGYMAGRRGQQDTTQVKQLLESQRAQLAESQKTIAGLKADLDTSRTQLSQATQKNQQTQDQQTAEASASQQKLSRLQSQVAAKQKENADLNNRLTTQSQALAASETETQNLRASVQSLTKQVNDSKQTDLINRLEAEITRLNQRLRQNSQQQTLAVLIWRGKVKKHMTVTITGNQPSTGALSGHLPGVPCVVEVQDPSRVSIQAYPSPGNNWGRLAFDVVGNGDTIVTLVLRAP